MTGWICSPRSSILPTEQRQIIEMKYFMGMRNPEVADVLNTSVSAVNGRQWRALAALRDRLEEGS